MWAVAMSGLVIRACVLYLSVAIVGGRVERAAANREYDFIVVGSGPGGSVVASRLSEDESVTVLLLEAGGTDIGNPDIQIVTRSVLLPGTDVDWQHRTIPQRHSQGQYENNVAPLPRGKVLGGTSSINYHVYIRGSQHDFDSWQDHGAQGWDYESAKPYFLRVENASTREMSDNLGRSGQLKLLRNYLLPTPILNLFRGAAEEIGIPYVDYNDDLEGLSHVTYAADRGIRQHAFAAYVRPFQDKRKERLHVIVHALVTKVLIRAGEPGEGPIAYGVQYLKNGQRFEVLARKEVILSAGAIGTPHLLLLSGIGPRKHLQSLNVSVVVDLPGVGTNFQDHVGYIGSFVADKIAKGRKPNINPELQYILNGTGPLSELSYLLMHIKSRHHGTAISASTSERPFPDLQFYVIPTQATEFLFAASLQHAKSRGTVRLKTANPEDYPLIDPQYFASKDDVNLLTEGFRIMEKFEQSSTFRKAGVKMVMSTLCNGTQHAVIPRSDDFYRCIIRNECATGNHHCCTARIGRAEDRYSVVDSQLRVHGVGRLRISDASVMPHLTTANLQGPVYMIGEKAADMIKQDWSLS